MNKTNAMRLLDAAGIKYTPKCYTIEDSEQRGIEIANQIGLNPVQVFKTLVARGDRTGMVVFCIPVVSELDLKHAAAISGNKKLELIAVKELLPLTGYIRGGCSPVGMKKEYPTYIDITALGHILISVSAGIRNCQIILDPLQLISYTSAKTFDNTPAG